MGYGYFGNYTSASTGTANYNRFYVATGNPAPFLWEPAKVQRSTCATCGFEVPDPDRIEHFDLHVLEEERRAAALAAGELPLSPPPL
jgi:hypothetical protein